MIKIISKVNVLNRKVSNDSAEKTEKTKSLENKSKSTDMKLDNNKELKSQCGSTASSGSHREVNETFTGCRKNY